MERFDYFRRVLHLGCLICSSYATAYLTTFSHAVFSGVTITGISEVDSFSIILYDFQPFTAFGKRLYLQLLFCSKYVTNNCFGIIAIIVILIIIIAIIIIIIVIFIIVTSFCQEWDNIKSLLRINQRFFVNELTVFTLFQFLLSANYLCNRFTLNSKFVKIRL